MSDNKRIAKNTIFLYFRMALIMLITLYTSRVVLDVLGASDYGLYNVVGGVVTMLGFLNGSISAGTSRFIAYELGIGNKEKLRDVFNVALVSHIVMAFIIFIIAETVGLWFVNTQLVFTEDRAFAVNVIYQLSILTAMLQFTQIPYTSDIIAHEEMAIYAYISILEVVLKLGMIFLLLKIHNVDMLIVYGLIIFIIQVFIIVIYRLYCLKKYEESHWRFIRDKQQYKQIFSFAGWDVVGNLCVITQGQGVNILLNMYFGPVVNAARAVAYQVQGAFSQFTGNFMTAVNPEIIKSFARKDYNAMINLINNASIFSYYLLLVFMLPILFKMEFVLGIWLKEIPEDTAIFTIIVLVNLMTRALARPIIIGTHASGNIKYLNLYAGIVGLFPLPIVWIALYFGCSAVVAFIIIFIFGLLANVIEIYCFKKEVPQFSVLQHLKIVYLKALILSIVVTIPIYWISHLFVDTFFSFCLYYIVSLITGSLLVLTLGLNTRQRSMIYNKIVQKIKQ